MFFEDLNLAVIGLPLAVEFDKIRSVVGFCINHSSIVAFKISHDITLEASDDAKNDPVGDQTTFNDLFHALQSALAENGKPYERKPTYRDFRVGDVRHSQADISKAANKLGYAHAE